MPSELMRPMLVTSGVSMGQMPPVVRDVDVADFEACAFAVEAARPECGETALVDERAERVGLVDDLAEFASAEEEVDGAGDGLAGDKVCDLGELVWVADAHAFLDGAAELEEALAEFINASSSRVQTAVAEMVDVVDLRDGPTRVGVGAFAAEVEDVLDGAEEVLGTDEHLIFRDVQIELAVDPEAADFAQW